MDKRFFLSIASGFTLGISVFVVFVLLEGILGRLLAFIVVVLLLLLTFVWYLRQLFAPNKSFYEFIIDYFENGSRSFSASFSGSKEKSKPGLVFKVKNGQIQSLPESASPSKTPSLAPKISPDTAVSKPATETKMARDMKTSESKADSILTPGLAFSGDGENKQSMKPFSKETKDRTAKSKAPHQLEDKKLSESEMFKNDAVAEKGLSKDSRKKKGQGINWKREIKSEVKPEKQSLAESSEPITKEGVFAQLTRLTGSPVAAKSKPKIAEDHDPKVTDLKLPDGLADPPGLDSNKDSLLSKLQSFAKRMMANRSEPLAGSEATLADIPGPMFLGGTQETKSRIQDHKKAYEALGSNDLNQAAIFLQKCHKRFPNRALYLNDLGVLHYVNGKYDDSLISLLQAQSLDSENGIILYNLALALKKKKKFNEALQRLLNAQRRNEDIGIIYHIASIYSLLGKFDLASEYLDLCHQFGLSVSILLNIDITMVPLKQHLEKKNQWPLKRSDVSEN